MTWRGFKYEYLVIDFMGLSKPARGGVLNGAGQQGWELVSVTGDMAYMRRLIVEVEEEGRRAAFIGGAGAATSATPTQKREEIMNVIKATCPDCGAELELWFDWSKGLPDAERLECVLVVSERPADVPKVEEEEEERPTPPPPGGGWGEPRP